MPAVKSGVSAVETEIQSLVYVAYLVVPGIVRVNLKGEISVAVKFENPRRQFFFRSPRTDVHTRNSRLPHACKRGQAVIEQSSRSRLTFGVMALNETRIADFIRIVHGFVKSVKKTRVFERDGFTAFVSDGQRHRNRVARSVFFKLCFYRNYIVFLRYDRLIAVFDVTYEIE